MTEVKYGIPDIKEIPLKPMQVGGACEQTTQKVDEILKDAPTELDTFKEVSDEINTLKEQIDSVETVNNMQPIETTDIDKLFE